MKMLLTVENEDGVSEFNEMTPVEGYIEMDFVPTVGTVLRFDPPVNNNEDACFIEIWGVDVHMDVPKNLNELSKVCHIHIFGKPEHRATIEGLIALEQFLSP